MGPSSRTVHLTTWALVTIVVAGLDAVFSVGFLTHSRSFFLDFGFPLAATASAFQLWTIAALVLALCWCRGQLIPLHRLPMAYVMPASFCFGGMYLVQNTSLIHNSLLFHCQLRPASIVLFSVVSPRIHDITHGPPQHRGRWLTAVVVLLGALISMAADPELNWLGTLVGVFHVFISAVHESLLVTIQAELDCDYVQLLAYTAPLAALGLTFLCHVIDDLGNQPVWPRGAAAWELFFTCVYAALTPVTAQLLSRRLSCVGFQSFGLMKLSVMLWVGYHSLRAPPTPWRVAGGALVCLLALTRYTSPLVPPSRPNKRRADGRAVATEALPEV